MQTPETMAYLIEEDVEFVEKIIIKVGICAMNKKVNKFVWMYLLTNC